MNYPLIKVNTAKILANSRRVVGLAKPFGIEVVGVTKAFCAQAPIARAIRDGGVNILADSRLQNLRKLRQEQGDVPLMLLRIPMPSEIPGVVEFADYSLVSEVGTAELLSQEAIRQGRKHKVVQMVDLGDLREGLWPDALPQALERISALPGIELCGLGTNLTCYGGVIPTRAVMEELSELATAARRQYGLALPVVSGGNSSSLGLLLSGEMPPGINQLRIGEGILLGRETADRQPLPGTHLDAFTLYAEVVELQEKPSVPRGQLGQDAFGGRPTFRDRGTRRRAIAAVGRQDVAIEGLTPLGPGIEILGGSSDHLLLDVSDAPTCPAIGDPVAFQMDYGALIRAMVSPYIEKVY